jgi:hypothetical protein
MPRRSSPRSQGGRSGRRPARAVCEDVRFAEVEWPRPAGPPRLVVRFGGGLSLLVEDREAIELAAEFIAAFRSHEHQHLSGQRKGGAR